jgi:hypothetical protein
MTKAKQKSHSECKDGYMLSLAVHPDELHNDLMRDFVGSRYVVVMVRLGDDEQPMNRENEFPGRSCGEAGRHSVP